MRKLPRSFYRRDSLELAPLLLNKLLVHGSRVVRIVEVEAYRGESDPASHAYRGCTARNATMFGREGHLYVYFTYGMHWCANVVCGEKGVARAVLLRAAAPVAGLAELRAARFGSSARRPPASQRDRDLCSGPAKLAQAMGLTGEHDGADLVLGDLGVVLAADGIEPPASPGTSTRIGLSAGTEQPWRFFVTGDPNVSRR
ncbi:MAG TPA: DNA-3-methyladenine glycosylase [Thermoleophilia bacterium]|nr:DNA-3-methyladenine glycosylase [Thermoleophilia bacterium]